MEKIALVTVNYNGGQIVIDTLLSLYQSQAASSFDLYIVDNDSTDGSLDVLKVKYPEATIIKAPGNLGFGRANNIALEMILSSNKYEYVCLFNPDMLFTNNWLTQLQMFMELNPKVAVVNPLIVYADKFNSVELNTSSKDIYFSVEDYRSLSRKIGDFRSAVKHVSIKKKEFTRINELNTNYYFVSDSEKVEVFVYDERGNGYDLELGGIKISNRGLFTKLRKVLFKLTKNLSLKIKKYTFATKDLKLVEENVEIVNSLGAGFKPGANLPDNLFFGHLATEVPRDPFAVQLWHGACALIRTNALRQVGLFDPKYFLYYEESDLGMRLNKAGFIAYAVPGVKVYHRERGSRSENTIKFMQDSQKIFINTWFKK